MLDGNICKMGALEPMFVVYGITGNRYNGHLTKLPRWCCLNKY